ncbi:uncharacterized protein LOC104895685 [Beta vulgaris subsp. vulgaris]|uniref:uncharacterized protein LOC104895685 n=1 Tax=Beta vulgaris subsp. vulgaris TaxID=3555 RepID=UPI00053FBE3C|nr:uncharacterized protein LOC104895685 [Beta vulgaris subsp. vulgaris]
MSPLSHYFSFTKFLLFHLLFASTLFASSAIQLKPQFFLARRTLLEKTHQQNHDTNLPQISSKSKSSTQNKTKLIKPSSSISSNSSSKKNQTKLIQSTLTSPKNKTKSSSKNVGAPKLHSNSTKSSDLVKPNSSPKNKTKSSSTLVKEITKLPQSDTTKNNIKETQKQKQKQKSKTPSPPTWMYNDENDEDYDFIAEIRDLPTKFHKTFIPDLHKISTTSKLYLTKTNKEITKTYIKPYVGKEYASSVAIAISCAFIIVPFLLVSLLFNHIKAFFSLQKLVIFTQIYLSIYFSILCLSSLITGLEPLRFFYATSQSTYVWLQVLQTLGYVMYLLMLIMYLILVFSTDSGLGQKFLSLAQIFVGFSVGLHYYMTVFHRVVLHQPPKTNWKVHGIYATCFLIICLLARAERRKKAYLEEDGEEGKLS